MDHLEMVERLVDKTGVSYTDAKEALETANWDLLDAVISLEKAGKTEPKSSAYATGNAQAVHPAQQGEWEQVPPREGANVFHSSDKKNGAARGFFRKVRDFLLRNKLIVRNNDGKIVLDLPVLVAVIILCVCFHAAVIIIIASLVFGFHYSFEGPELGKESVNEAADSVGNMVRDISQELKEKHDAHKAEKEERENANQN